MKRGQIVLGFVLAIALVVSILGGGLASAAVSGIAADACTLSVRLVNQDPYPAVPGDYVKLVFQVDGASDPTCGEITAKLTPEYPFSLDPGVSNSVKVKAGTYLGQDFQSYFLAPYQVRIDKDALDKDYTIKLNVGSSNTAAGDYRFNVTVKDQRTDFEVSVKDYSYTTNIMILEIINVGKNDAEAVTVDMSNQDNMQVKGSSRNIVGSLNANEDTTFNFEGIPKDGSIKMTITYTDKNNVRRSIEKTVTFNSAYFQNRIADKKSSPVLLYVIIAVVVILLIFWWRRRSRKNKSLK